MIRDYVALDLEMTGLSPRKDAILEIGAVKVRDMEVTETYTAMVNPGFPVPEHVTKLTGITTEMAQQGREIHTVLPALILDFFSKMRQTWGKPSRIWRSIPLRSHANFCRNCQAGS